MTSPNALTRELASRAYRAEKSRPLGKSHDAEPGRCYRCGLLIARKSIVMVDGARVYHLPCGFRNEMELT